MTKVGIYQAYWGKVGGGQRYIAVVADILAREHDVEIVHHCKDFESTTIGEQLQVDLSRVSFRYLPRVEREQGRLLHPLKRLQRERDLGRAISEPYEVFVDSSDTPPFFCHADHGVLVTHFPLVSFEQYHSHDSDEWRTWSRPRRWLASLYHNYEWALRFATYDFCIVNSQFTRQWINRLWRVDARVLYPPLRDCLRPRHKEQVIVSIGAFHASQHKKQTVMLDTFKAMCDRGLTGWRYIMIGTTAPTNDDQQYLERVRNSAQGYPVDIWTDALGSVVQNTLEESMFLWHSMGYGVDEAREPQRMEHFGMVVTEALAAGCVPIVFDGGGLREIVIDGMNGYLWRTPDQLEARTVQLIRDSEMLNKVSVCAVEDASRFARPQFERQLLAALKPLLTWTT